MNNIIKQWSMPDILKERNIKFVFDSNEIIDKVNSLESKHSKKYYEDLHCREGSIKFCLYNFELNEIVFTMDFLESGNFFQSNYIKLQILYVNNPKLRNKGIATHYLRKLRDYAVERGIPKIKIHVDTNDKLFENKDNALSKEELTKFYRSIEIDKVNIDIY